MSTTKLCRSAALVLTLGLTFPALAMDTPSTAHDPTLPQRALPIPNQVQSAGTNAAATNAAGTVKGPGTPTVALAESLTRRGRDQ